MPEPSTSSATHRRGHHTTRPSRRKASWLLAAAALALAFAPVQDKTAPFPRHGAYIGRGECRECHEDKQKEILEGTHAPVVDDPHLQSCQTCHGPGKRHADHVDNLPELITFPPKLDVAGQQRVCGRCHQAEIRDHGGDLEGFFAAGKKCTDCHRVHKARQPPPHPDKRFTARAETLTAATGVGAKHCVECHPLRNEKLAHTGHAGLMANKDEKGCESCHGNGNLHVETGGLSRLITRPDQARDGVTTCRSCHESVDPIDFHWKDRHRPLLSWGMTCTTCHEVHAPIQPKAPPEATPPADRPPTGPMMRGELAPVDNGSCARCHAPAYQVLHGTVHQSLAARDLPVSKGCGACHAGAEEHARGPGHKALVQSMHGTDAAHQLATCSACHSGDEALRHARAGSHHRNEVTCLTCHSPAESAGKTREEASKRCAECHAKAAAEFRMPNRHPVAVGANDHGSMLCVDCHDPHSARPRIRDRRLREATCVECHKQYRGPFVFAHQASRLDGCVACHSPHGSPNRRMLKQANTQQNCIACHADFPSFHDQTSGAVFTNCLNCHTEVHGSNHSRFLLR